MLVYAIGTVDYDNTTTLPDGVYSTLELAKAHEYVKAGATWEYDDEIHWWYSEEGPESWVTHWVIAEYEVVESSVEEDGSVIVVAA